MFSQLIDALARPPLPSFSVGGVRFNREQVMDGDTAYWHDVDAGAVQGILVETPEETLSALQHSGHGHLFKPHQVLTKRLQELTASTSLSAPVSGVLLTNYGTAVHDLVPIGTAAKPEYAVSIDTAALKMLAPNEVDGVFAYNLAGLEAAHLPRAPVAGVPKQLAQVLAQDKRAVEMTANAEAYLGQLKKIHTFMDEVVHSTASSRMWFQVEKLAHRINRPVVGHWLADKLYPEGALEFKHLTRVKQVEGFVERIARGAYQAAEHGTIRL